MKKLKIVCYDYLRDGYCGVRERVILPRCRFLPMKTKRSPAKAVGLKGGAQADGMQGHATAGAASSDKGGAQAEGALPGSFKTGHAKKKRPVPKGVIWWHALAHHPVIDALGAEVFHQRHVLRGWSLDDLSAASGISKSHLWDVEHGEQVPSLEVLERLETAFGMTRDGLMRMSWRRMDRDRRVGKLFAIENKTARRAGSILRP